MLRSFRNISALRKYSRHFSAGPLTILSSEEQLFKETVASFAQSDIQPLVRSMDESKEMDKNMLSNLFANGLFGIEIPEKYDGAGASFLSSILCIEELAKVDPSVSVCVDVQNTLVNNFFINYSSDSLKEKYLPKLATDTIGSFCLSEASSGSDAFALKTTAKKVDGGYVLNGEKLWITNSGEAGIFIVLANLDPSKGYKGITTFVVERSFEGLSIGKKEDKLGIRASSTCPVIMENVFVPEENLLGTIGHGYKYAIETLNEGRIGIAAQMLGLAQGAFDATMPYLGEREQFGQKIGTFQTMAAQYAEAAIEIEATRLLVYNAARRKEAGLDFAKEAAMAKWKASEVAGSVSKKCVEWMGGVGFVKEYPQEKFYRDCLIGSIYEGTSNIQLQTIAKNLQKQYW